MLELSWVEVNKGLMGGWYLANGLQRDLEPISSMQSGGIAVNIVIT